MKVLISNDDGPPSLKESPFILPFIEHLEKLGWDVRVCLPDSQKSWIAKSFMITEEVQLRYYNRKTKEITIEKENDNDFYLLSGTPATCVNIALNHLFKDEEFDLVISGPNFGRNFSNIFTLASGTVGAAMEGVLNKQKAVSVSFCFCNQRPECIKNCCETASDIIEHLYSLSDNDHIPWPENVMYNVNIPMVEYRCPIHITDFHKTNYGSLFKRVEDKIGKNRFIFSPDFTANHNKPDGLPGTDKWALMNKYVSGKDNIHLYL
ncbi:survival protein sure-like phosphatase/nucleotidase [Cokeromyces recurvatus]|uniref:survival protein sure-like phosphatase/nucleotidase n=1 Tax=Cokeromyces recurvatus TaxID=90255 RepID=UPI00221F0D3A|nr:survival protein sure-like phosphatase/nucleotidase [Cokeromyces recurvatus]KAI7899216.1 survival protein sure-like phosphatase/nucleotidase [Cokeromyces recurvatus]